MDIIDRLHNCPNCGGTLQDDGACRFCGSKVYDFLQVDLKDYKPTYIRMKFDGKIILMPVRFELAEIHMHDDTPVFYSDDITYQTFGCWEPKGTLNFTVVGDTIVEDTKITGSEY